MLTPVFRLDQTLSTLKVYIHAPLAKLSELEVCIEGDLFFFTASPYFLKFELPGPVFDEQESIDFELKDNDIIVTLQKREQNYYKDINLLTKLLTPNNATRVDPIARVEDLTDNTDDSFIEFDWFSEGDDYTTEEFTADIVISAPTYGFGGSRSGLFQSESDLSCVVELPNPDHVGQRQRSVIRESQENEKFSAYHYLADFFEPEAWQFARDSRPPWKSTSADASPELTNDESHRLLTFTTRTLPPNPIEPADRVAIYLGLADLLLAYTYDYRVREGEEMTESGWNIAKLAATLSWFEVFRNLPHLLIAFYRRALIYPLVRNWRFCALIQSDVATLLQSANVKSWCLKCLLSIRHSLIQYPGYHVFADLYVNDYIVWIQKRATEEHLHALGSAMANFKVRKPMVRLNLENVEQLGRECLEGEKLADGVQQLAINSTA